MLLLGGWTVRAKAFKSIIDNYPFLIETFENDLEDSVMPSEMSARIHGIISIMQKFEHYFAFELGYFILRHTDNLAQKLQTSNCQYSGLKQDTEPGLISSVMA